MTVAPQIVWLRRDLRLADQAALLAAIAAGPVIPVYVLDDETPGARAMGGASRWWLDHSLAALDLTLRQRGSQLILRRGRAPAVLAGLAAETGAAAIHAIRHYEPWWRAAEAEVGERVRLHLHHGNYLAPPGAVKTGSGKPYKIYTPFWRALSEHLPPPVPVPAPERIEAPDTWPASDSLDSWKLLPTRPDWAGGLATEWTPGETAGLDQLADFAPRVGRYDVGRNLPSEDSSARLSPHLHFGELSPATVWHVMTKAGGYPETFLKELAWRDYAQNVICQVPDYGDTNARARFDALPWRDVSEPAVAADLEAWQQGRTGYPIVDAGMRQLWVSGWMHNRVRMIAASFLIKHLLIDWRVGERWFWDTLIDADLGNNAVNWQWVAGTGIDSNMFVRIMAPLVQSEKFAAALYIRRWVPELGELSDAEIHDPDDLTRAACGYPMKVIDHREARDRALAAYRVVAE